MPGEQSMQSPALYGGVSQQPARLRFPHQVEDAINADFSVVDGASKRPGTRYVAKPTGLTSAANYRLHPINRDGAEKYAVIYGNGQIKVFRVDGVEATVNISADAATYLALNTPTADQIRMVSIADYTLIANTTVALSPEADPEGPTITGTYYDYWSMQANHASQGQNEFNETENAAGSYPAGVYQRVLPSGTRFGQARFTLGTNWRSHMQSWDDDAKNPMGFGVMDQREYAQNTSASFVDTGDTIEATGFFTDYTWQSGDFVYLSGGSPSITAGFYEVLGRVSDDAIQIAVTGGGDRSGVTVVRTFRRYQISLDFFGAPVTSMYALAKRIQDALVTAGATNMVCGYHTDGTNHYLTFLSGIAGNGSWAPTFIAYTTGGLFNMLSGGPLDSGISSRTDLTGTVSGSTDTTAPALRYTTWSTGDGLVGRIDASKMPVRMVRSQISPPVFDVSRITWAERTDGDDATNPAPTIFTGGKKLSDMTVHRGRLALAAGENIAFSESENFFNFFLTDADNITDADPFEVSLSSDSVTVIDFMVNFPRTLVIFTKADRQFELSAPEALTASTAAITATTKYSTLTGVRPAPMGSRIAFIGKAFGWSRVYEYFYDELRAASIAADLTGHCPRYLPPGVRTIQAVPNAGAILVLPDDCCDIFIHRSYYEDGTNKLQSAWGKHSFASNYRIADIAVVDNYAYMLVENQSQSQYIIERLMISPEDDEEEHYLCPCDETFTTTTTTTTTSTTTTSSTTSPPTTTTPPVITQPPAPCCSTTGNECWTKTAGTATLEVEATVTYRYCCFQGNVRRTLTFNYDFSDDVAFIANSCATITVSASNTQDNTQYGCDYSSGDPEVFTYTLQTQIQFFADGTWRFRAWLSGLFAETLLEITGSGCSTASGSGAGPLHLYGSISGCGPPNDVQIVASFTASVPNRQPCP